MADVLLEPEDQEIWASHLNRHMDAFGRDQMLMMVGNMRARLESAEGALREAERRTMRCLTVGGKDRYWWRCDLCEQRRLDGSTTPRHKPTCPFAALGAAGEEQEKANG